MNWSNKYKEITSGFYKCAEDISAQYPECTDFEKCVIALRLKGWTYGDIQKKLGMPPKKQISSILKKWAPETIDNSKEKEVKISKWESELYNIVKGYPEHKITVVIEDEDYMFYIINKTLLFSDWSASDNVFGDLNTITQQQFLIAVKDHLNE